MRSLKLMADYQCFPLWETTNNELENLNPTELDISQKLKQDINDWGDKYDNTLNLNDPANSGFLSEEEEKKFRIEGENLQRRLKQELGETFKVDFFP